MNPDERAAQPHEAHATSGAHPVAVEPATVVPAALSGAGRIAAIDVLRGIAVLGILPMNILTFAMPDAAIFSPRNVESLFPYEGANKIAFDLTHLLFDMKMMSIFAMLFGAGVLLFAGKATSQAEQREVRKRWFMRCSWLLLFGMLHAYFLWYGDILVLYAVCGLAVVWWCRRLPPMTLAVLGSAGVLVAAALWSMQFLLMHLMLSAEPGSMGSEGNQATAQLMAGIAPTPEQLQAIVDAYHSDWSTIQRERVHASLMVQIFMIPFWGLWRASGLMLIGMALLKWGVLSAARSTRFYAVMAAVCYSVGLPIVWWGIGLREAMFDTPGLMIAFGMKPNELGSVIVALGHVAAVMLIVKQGWLHAAQRTLAAVGRAAFSNYIFQSIVGTLIFYGYGLSQYAHHDRAAQWLFVLAIWAVQIALTLAWSSVFRFGPLEWAWRSLTYCKPQPMR